MYQIMSGDFYILYYLIWMVKIFIPAYMAIKGVGFQMRFAWLHNLNFQPEPCIFFALPQGIEAMLHTVITQNLGNLHANLRNIRDQFACSMPLYTQMWYSLQCIFIIFLCILNYFLSKGENMVNLKIWKITQNVYNQQSHCYYFCFFIL